MGKVIVKPEMHMQSEAWGLNQDVQLQKENTVTFSKNWDYLQVYNLEIKDDRLPWAIAYITALQESHNITVV